MRSRRKAILNQPHIAAARLRERGLEEVLEFDPLDGGVEAQVLFLYEKPGSMTTETGQDLAS